MKIDPRNYPLGTKVTVRLTTGEEVNGVLKDHSDWLTGCPVVETDGGEKIGIGYQGDVVSVVHEQEAKP
ncbi:hypothetical protein WIC93_14320 [Enterobacter cloacae]|uniref:hypothetical protein n=1 Tax=Enterobacter TaxID=547 RepID=UPI000735D320|nr:MULTISPECIES: hypothetical protein [Enterobacter]EKM5720903.1 hypothetical protein [Enterobacter cloacae]EKP1125740.1 hypothetical protein [Enterobacter cloacae]EKU2772252.1 hypothetical protein [Enterobacter cloacae]KSY69271.1 hypothetical protein APU11_13240 [Enterobacter sp. 50793107]KTH24867.1 hypothetical protein ASV29_14535 [Enterobacter cloacae subsp. cloacae]